MSIPTVFHNSNCQSLSNIGGGGMLQFCNTFDSRKRPPADYCEIFTQDDYNTYQIGCINYRGGTFIDNNNNTVAIERPPGMVVGIDAPVEFPVGSHNNYVFIPRSQQHTKTTLETLTPTSTAMTLHTMCHGFYDSTSGTSCSYETMWIPVTSWTPWTYDPETYTGTPQPSYPEDWDASSAPEEASKVWSYTTYF